MAAFQTLLVPKDLLQKKNFEQKSYSINRIQSSSTTWPSGHGGPHAESCWAGDWWSGFAGSRRKNKHPSRYGCLCGTTDHTCSMTLWKRMLTNKCGKVSCCKLKKVTQAFVQFGFLTPKSKCPTWIRSQQGARRRNRKNRTPGASTGASRVSLDLGRHKVDTVTRRAMPGVRKV